MYTNPYINNINLNERIDNEIERLKQMKSQIHQPVQPITQNFQLAPTNRDMIRYASSIDEVNREMVTGDTPYFSKDMSVVWIKNTKGEIKTYELTEIVPKDEKDIQIEFLQNQIEELRKEMKKYDEHIANDTKPEDTTNTKWNDETNGESIEENKPSSISRISNSKKK